MLARRMASTVSSGPQKRKIVLVGAGFLGSYIARELISDSRNRVVLVSRNPEKLYKSLSPLGSQIQTPKSADITSSDLSPLREALKDADAVVSLAGILVGSGEKMYNIQQKGAENVVQVAKEVGREGVRLVLVSAIGADEGGVTPYQKTKAAAEKAFLRASPDATIIRPSIIFGPGDSFFTRFATLAKYLPFLPVFGGGVVRFQPVYAGDVARAVEIACRDDPAVIKAVGGKIVEAGGPDLFTYREIMQLVLRYSGLEGRRAVLSLPYWLAMIQAFFLEKLPENLFTVTRDQVRQLRNDNIVSTSTTHPPMNSINFETLLKDYPSSLPSSAAPGDAGLRSVYDILPMYMGEKGERENGKRVHGRSRGPGLDEVKKMGGKGK